MHHPAANIWHHETAPQRSSAASDFAILLCNMNYEKQLRIPSCYRQNRDCAHHAVLPMAADCRHIRQLHPGLWLWGCHFCLDMGPSGWSQGLCLLWQSIHSHIHDIISVWSLQALSHSRCTVIGCVCILFGALVFQQQDIQAFLGIALPGSFTNKPDIVRHTSDSCTCLAGHTNTAMCLLVLLANMPLELVRATRVSPASGSLSTYSRPYLPLK